MLASSGEITEPCPVPLSLTVTTPSSRTPALSHFWIRRIIRESLIRCSTKRMSHSQLTESKKLRINVQAQPRPAEGFGKGAPAQRSSGDKPPKGLLESQALLGPSQVHTKIFE